MKDYFSARKAMLFVSCVFFSVSAFDVVWAAEYEKKIKQDCLTDLYEAFLQPDKEPRGEILGFGLTRVSCDHEGSGVGYEKDERRLSVGISDNDAAAKLARELNTPNQLGEMKLKSQKLVISQSEMHIRAYEELLTANPSFAATYKEDTPPPIRRELPMGGTLYIARHPCSSGEEQCGSVEGHALIGDRFWVEIQIEDHAAAQSDDAAVGAMNQVLETVDWGKLRSGTVSQ